MLRGSNRGRRAQAQVHDDKQYPKLKQVSLQENSELMDKIMKVHNKELSADYINKVMSSTVSHDKILSSPMYLYRQSLGHGMQPMHAIHRSIHRIPKQLLGSVHRDCARGFNGIYSKHGNYFLATFQDRSLKLFNSSDPLKMKLMTTREPQAIQWSVLDIAFSPNERTVAFSGWAEHIYLVDMLNEDRPIRSLSMKDRAQRVLLCAFSIKFDASGQYILAGGYEGTIFIGDVERLEGKVIDQAHPRDIGALSFVDEGGHVFVSGGDDAILRVFDRRTFGGGDQKPVPVGCFMGHTCGVTYIDSKGDSRYLLSNSKDQTIRLWDMRNMGSISNIDEVYENLVKRPSFHWDYRYQGMPPEFSPQNLHPLSVDHSLLVLRGHEVRQTLIRARFSPALTTGQRYIYSGCACGCWHLWDTLTGEMLTVEGRDHTSRKTVTRDVSWHPSEAVVCTTDFMGNIRSYVYKPPDFLDNFTSLYSHQYLQAEESPDSSLLEFENEFLQERWDESNSDSDW